MAKKKKRRNTVTRIGREIAVTMAEVNVIRRKKSVEPKRDQTIERIATAIFESHRDDLRKFTSVDILEQLPEAQQENIIGSWKSITEDARDVYRRMAVAAKDQMPPSYDEERY